jgi:hypothetical protein
MFRIRDYPLPQMSLEKPKKRKKFEKTGKAQSFGENASLT